MADSKRGPHFGPRVQGAEGYAKEAKAYEKGETHFGVRVTGARSGGDGAQARARANSEFGPLVTAEAERTDHMGKGGDVAVDELENILTENPTFFDQLYENEMSRPGGPRHDALEILDLVEMGPKGAGRQEIHQEIRLILDESDLRTAQKLAEQNALREIAEERQERMDENEKLVDAGRLRSLAEREEDLQFVRKSGSKQADGASSDQNAEVSRRAGERLGAGRKASGRSGGGSGSRNRPRPHARKRARDVKPETQARTPRANQRPPRKQAK